MLKPVVSSLEEVAEPFRSEYIKQSDGRYILDMPVEEHPGVAGLKNSLVNAKEERRQAREQLEKFANVDPEKYRAMLTHEQQIQEGKLIAEGKVEELLELRTKALRENLLGETARERQAREALQRQLDTLVIDNAAHAAAKKFGVRTEAMEDVLSRVRATFKTKDGQAVAFSGENILYSKSGTEPLGIEEWMSSLPATAAHLFEPSKGTSAPGGTPRVAPGGPGTVHRSDQQAFLANLADIAKGKIKVIP